jgi:hypothetical protein
MTQTIPWIGALAVLIFLDTTELYKDYRLKKPDFTLLREFLNHSNAKLCIPSIVVEESANHLREAIAKDVNQLNSVGRSLQRLIPDYKPVKVDIDPTAEAQRYKKELTESLKYVATFIPYDDVKVRIVVERALARRKPFDGNGQKGFRDALLWESLLTVLAAEKQPVILITNNTDDFGEHGKLAADLQADVTTLGLEGCPVSDRTDPVSRGVIIRGRHFLHETDNDKPSDGQVPSLSHASGPTT